MRVAEKVSPKRLCEARLHANLSQGDAAFAIRQHLRSDSFRPTERSIRRWEKGTNAPHSDIVPAIAAAYGVTLDALYGDDEDEEEPDAVRRVAADLIFLGRGDLARDLLRRAAVAEAGDTTLDVRSGGGNVEPLATPASGAKDNVQAKGAS